MPITSLLFTVGSVAFFGFEAPEVLRGVGGTQSLAEHDFPGGVRTQQVFGSFPSKVSWSGIFTGTDALLRMREVDRLRVAGVEVPLIYGNTMLLGIVEKFEAMPKHQWLIPYEMTFCPRIDQTSGSVLDELISIVSLINSALGVLSSLVAIGRGLATSGGTLLPVVDVQQAYFPMPPTMLAPTTDLVNATVDALQAALGLPENIAPSDAERIQAAAQAAADAAQPLLASGDPAASSAASDIMGYIGTIVAGVAFPRSSTTELQVINPNLLTISSQYYGDPSQWRVIAAASGIVPADPLPIGEFVLTIPSVA